MNYFVYLKDNNFSFKFIEVLQMKKKNDSSIETKEDGSYVGSDVPHLKTQR